MNESKRFKLGLLLSVIVLSGANHVQASAAVAASSSQVDSVIEKVAVVEEEVAAGQEVEKEVSTATVKSNIIVKWIAAIMSGLNTAKTKSFNTIVRRPFKVLMSVLKWIKAKLSFGKKLSEVMKDDAAKKDDSAENLGQAKAEETADVPDADAKLSALKQ